MQPSVPPAITSQIESAFGAKVTGFSAASGGCINSGGKLTTTAGTFFLKWNDRARFPDMFSAEAKGLTLLRDTRAVFVPKVIMVGDAGTSQFLLLEYVPEAPRASNYWGLLGSGLAVIHKNSSEHFGLDHDNYIGSLRQRNRTSDSWVDFFIRERLEVQLRQALDAGKIGRQVSAKLNSLFSRIHEWLPEEPPALVHGDLWGGNLMTSPGGQPCLIDPAVYYGHREMDLAMMKLFGGFHADCFLAYAESFPLAPRLEERIDLYNLYPLLVHVNLFGGGYASQVAAIVNRFA